MSDLQNEYEAAGEDEIILIGVSLGGGDVKQFTAQHGSKVTEFWLDPNSNYTKMVPPGGFAYPIEVVIDRSGIITYLSTTHVNGAAMEAAKKAL